jgi:hypothetical protein
MRSGAGQWLAETVATAGRVLVILKSPETKVSTQVAAYRGAALGFASYEWLKKR